MVANKKILLILYAFLLSACTSPTPTSPTNTPILADLTPPSSPTLPPAIVRPTKTIEATPTPEPYTDSLAGLIYYDQQGVWKVAEDEAPFLLFDFQGEEIRSVRISPNLDKILYRNAQTQIYIGHVVADIHTGETVESFYGDYALCWIDWWPARPDLLLVGLHPVDEEEGFSCYTAPAIKQWNGPIIEILGTEYTFPASKAGSPDGSQVAFDDFYVPYIYTWGQGKERFDYQAYGFNEFETLSFTDPVWSPSGRWLAWFVFGRNGEEYFQGIALFDMNARTSKFLAPLEVLGFDGGRGYLEWSSDESHLLLNNPAKEFYRVINIESEEILYSQDDGIGWPSSWSPDGKWLAYSVNDGDSETRSIVVDAIDDSESYNLSSFMLDVWKPDSTSLILQAWDDEASSAGEFFILDLMSGKYYLTDLSSDIHILAWAAD